MAEVKVGRGGEVNQSVINSRWTGITLSAAETRARRPRAIVWDSNGCTRYTCRQLIINSSRKWRWLDTYDSDNLSSLCSLSRDPQKFLLENDEYSRFPVFASRDSIIFLRNLQISPTIITIESLEICYIITDIIGNIRLVLRFFDRTYNVISSWYNSRENLFIGGGRRRKMRTFALYFYPIVHMVNANK